MNGRIKLITKDRFVVYTSIASILFLLFAFVLIILSYRNLPPLVPVFNSMPWGISRLYDSSVVISLPIIMLAVFITNTMITALVYKRFVLLGRIVSFNSFLFCLLATLAYLQILFLIY